MKTNELLLDLMLNIAERMEGSADELRACAEAVTGIANVLVAKADALDSGFTPEEIAEAIANIK